MELQRSLLFGLGDGNGSSNATAHHHSHSHSPSSSLCISITTSAPVTVPILPQVTVTIHDPSAMPLSSEKAITTANLALAIETKK